MNRYMLIILILPILIILNGCAPDRMEKKTPVAIKGILDLRGWDFAKDGPIKLNGEWEFYWKHHLITQKKNNSVYPEKNGYIYVPQSWNHFMVNGKKVGGSGYASYRIKILINKTDRPLAFRFSTISTAYHFYANKNRLVSVGIPGSDKASVKPAYLPQKCTYVPDKNDEELDIILEISNFHEMNGGLWNTIQIGDTKDIRRLSEKSLMIDFILFGCIFIMGLYHWGLFALRRKDSSTIYFTGLCFLISLRILITHEECYFTELFPAFNWFILHKLDYWTYSLSVPFLFAFIHSLFPDEFSIKYLKLIVSISLVYTFIILVSPPVIYGSLVLAYQIFTVCFALYAIQVIALAVYQKRIGAKAISAGFFILFATFINDILYQNQILQTGFLSSIGILVLLLSQAFVLSVRFSRAFSTIESLEEKYRDIFNNAIEGIYQYSLEGKLLNANPALAKILGYETPEHLIQSISGNEKRLFIDTAQMDATLDKLMKNEELLNFETQLFKLDGSIIWTLGNAKAIKSSKGKISHVEGMVLDITERKQIEKEINKAKEAAEAANEIKSQFLANMSHEIRTPLTGVVGMADLLSNTSLTSEQQEYTDTIKCSSSLLLTIVNDILDFSKIEADQLELENINFDLRIIVDEVHSILSVQALEKKLNFTCHIDPDTPVLYNGDPDRLKQVLINITSNAIKFTHSGSVVVSIATVYDDNSTTTVLFTVRDTGIGIPENKIGKLFTMFSQADISMSRKYGGTGLGLAISKELVECMGGKVGVTSKLGEGSVFHFSVKLKKQSGGDKTANTEKEKPSTPLLSHADKSKIRILVVEDNPVNQAFTVKLLNKIGYHTHVAENGQKAIDILSDDIFDLVLMDVQMPVMDGFAATRIIRNLDSAVHRHDIPVIAMTAHAMKEDRKKCFQAGMDDYITKPFKSSKLAEVLEHHLTRHKC